MAAKEQVPYKHYCAQKREIPVRKPKKQIVHATKGKMKLFAPKTDTYTQPQPVQG